MTRAPAEALVFRFPFLKAQRARIANCAIRPGLAAEKLSDDSMVVTGNWPDAEPLMVTPVFPGTMRFIAKDRTKLPEPDDVVMNGGLVDPTYLDGLATIEGRLLVSIQQVDLIRQLEARCLGQLTGTAPTHAFYGPVKLGRAFLQATLLDPGGLKPGVLKDATGKEIPPGSPEWLKLILCRFLLGDYEIVLHGGAGLANDDAQKYPMPSVVLNGQSFELGLTFCRPKGPKEQSDDPLSNDYELVAADLFLRHLATLMRETALPPAVNDPVLAAVFQGEYSSGPWFDRLRAQLAALGFGAKDGSSGIDMIVREFQFAAASALIAEPSDPAATPADLAVRDFRGLKQIANPDLYDGLINGFANHRTRTILAAWTAANFRNPLIMPAFVGALKGRYVAPAGNPIAGFEDVWNRLEMQDPLGRVYAADFTRNDLRNGRIAHADLKPVGHFVATKNIKPGGPTTPWPWPDVQVPSAEIKPDVMLGMTEASLVAALADRAHANATTLGRASSFKVVRAISEVESIGYLDVINAFDNAGISLAPYHWAGAGLEGNPAGLTELGGFAAFCAAGVAARRLGTDKFRSMGLAAKIDDKLLNALIKGKVPTGVTGTFMAALGFLDDHGHARAMPDRDGPARFLPSWRSVYRWRCAQQTNPDYGRSAWAYALHRLSTLHTMPMGMAVMRGDTRVHPKAGPTIGSVFTTEALMAVIARWHVKAPDGVVEDRHASDGLADAYRRAAVVAVKDSTRWEIELLAELLGAVGQFAQNNPEHGELPSQMETLLAPDWIDQTATPPTIKPIGKSNPFSYTLDPRLRLLDGKFELAPS